VYLENFIQIDKFDETTSTAGRADVSFADLSAKRNRCDAELDDCPTARRSEADSSGAV
jgi:hypothetical protein